MFNEPHYLKLIFLLADTQDWLKSLTNEVQHMLPAFNKRKLQKSNYNLNITAWAHILERHYYKIPRHPGKGKFHIPLEEILYYIKEAQQATTQTISGCSSIQRIVKAKNSIGFNKNGEPTAYVTIITDSVGNISTAFPGLLPCAKQEHAVVLQGFPPHSAPLEAGS